MSKTISRSLVVLVVSGLAALTLSTRASAAPCPYPNENPDCPAQLVDVERLSPAEANAALSGADTTFVPGELVTVTLPPPGGEAFGPETEVMGSLAEIGEAGVLTDVQALGKATVLRSGLNAGATVTPRLNPLPLPLGTFTSNASGFLVTSFRVPLDASAGLFVAQFSGVGADDAALVYALPITITGDGDGDGGGLPFTGVEVGIASLVSAGLLGAGAIAVAAGRRRKGAPGTA